MNDLESFLKERMEESNIIFENLPNTKSSHDQQDPLTLSPEEETLLQEDNILSEWIEKQEDEKESEETTNIEKEDSDSDFDSFPKKGDKVKVKYPDVWYDGRVESAKRNYFSG